jgi:hypothetical protein
MRKRNPRIGAAALSAFAALVALMVSAASWFATRLFWCNGPLSSGFVCPGAGPLDRDFGHYQPILLLMLGMVSIGLGALSGLLCLRLGRQLRDRIGRWRTALVALAVGAALGPAGLVVVCMVAGPPMTKEFGPFEPTVHWPSIIKKIPVARNGLKATLIRGEPPNDATTILVCGILGGAAGITCAFWRRGFG